MMMTMLRRFVGPAALLSLGGCTLFPTPDPPRILDLPPAISSSTPPSAHTLPVSLRLDTPQASEPVSGTHVLIRPQDTELGALPDARWRDTAPVLLRDYLLESLRARSGIKTLVTDTSPAVTDLTLISELSRFEAVQTGDGVEIVIAWHAQVIDNHSRAILCNRDFRTTQRSGGEGADDLARAFGGAAATLANSTRPWLTECLADRADN